MNTAIRMIVILCILLPLHADAWPWDKKKTESVKTEKAVSSEKTKAAKNPVLKNGMTEQELIAALGEPKGEISGGSKKTLMYDGVQIQLIDGRVANLPGDIDQQLKSGKKEHAENEAFVAKQKKKGLVLYHGTWMTPAEKKRMQTGQTPAKAGKSKSKPRAVIMLGKDRRPINHSSLVVKGRVTVVDFYADWCGPCRTLAPKLDQLVRSRKDVVLRKVNIGDWGSRVANQYNVTSVPNVRVFDRNGNMVAAPTSSLQRIDAAIRTAQRQ